MKITSVTSENLLVPSISYKEALTKLGIYKPDTNNEDRLVRLIVIENGMNGQALHFIVNQSYVFKIDENKNSGWTEYKWIPIRTTVTCTFDTKE